MRLIKLALFSFVFIFLVVTAISLLIPSHIRISKATNVLASRDSIFSLIKNENNWHRWHPIYKDSAAVKEWQAADKKVLANTDSTFVLEMKKPDRKSFVTGWQLYHYPHTDSLTIQWYMDFKLSWYPWEKFSSMFYENTYGLMMEQGLSNLKQQLYRKETGE